MNLFVASNADIKLDNGRTVHVTQETRYPWDGAVKMTVSPDQAAPLTIHVRIPGWARNEPISSDLYRYADRPAQSATLKVDGKAVPITADKGYVNVTRRWQKGDTIELSLPMTVRRVVANSQVAADQGRVALERGPIVYAAEWVDNPDKKVRNLVLPDSAPLSAEFHADLLKGVEVLKGRAVAYWKDEKGGTVAKEQEFTAIPYSAWANRGSGEMTVWLANSASSVTPAPFPTLTTTASVTTSGTKSPLPIQDGDDPRASNDGSYYFDWWPQGTASGEPNRVTTGWVEYHWEKPVTVSQSELYWFDDTGRGGVRVPAVWRILYRDGAEWKPVRNTGAWGAERDKFNHVSFDAVTTTALRLEVDFQPTFSAGLQRWRVK